MMKLHVLLAVVTFCSAAPLVERFHDHRATQNNGKVEEAKLEARKTNVLNAVVSKNSINAINATSALNANNAVFAGVAMHAEQAVLAGNVTNGKSVQNAKYAFSAKDAGYATYARKAISAVYIVGKDSKNWPKDVKQFLARKARKASRKAVSKVGENEVNGDDEDKDGDWLEKYLKDVEQIEGTVKGQDAEGDEKKWPAAVDNSVNAKRATEAINAEHAVVAGRAMNAKHAIAASNAKNARFAKNAVNAREAVHATNAMFARVAQKALYAITAEVEMNKKTGEALVGKMKAGTNGVKANKIDEERKSTKESYS